MPKRSKSKGSSKNLCYFAVICDSLSVIGLKFGAIVKLQGHLRVPHLQLQKLLYLPPTHDMTNV